VTAEERKTLDALFALIDSIEDNRKELREIDDERRKEMKDDLKCVKERVAGIPALIDAKVAAASAVSAAEIKATAAVAANAVLATAKLEAAAKKEVGDRDAVRGFLSNTARRVIVGIAAVGLIVATVLLIVNNLDHAAIATAIVGGMATIGTFMLGPRQPAPRPRTAPIVHPSRDQL
jgi:uncharacterized protein YhaN